MSTHEVLLQIEDPLVQMRMYINRARLIMRDMMMDYFHDVGHQTAHSGDAAPLEVLGFKESTIRAEIIEDALYYMEKQLHTLETIREQLGKDQ